MDAWLDRLILIRKRVVHSFNFDQLLGNVQYISLRDNENVACMVLFWWRCLFIQISLEYL